MMFKQEMAKLILEGKKTQTRRTPRKTVYKTGRSQPIQINYHSKAIGRIWITNTYMQRLRDMTYWDVQAEGFGTFEEYMAYLKKINPKYNITPDMEVRVYEFELASKESQKSTPEASK